eukprot:COSAG03_NODE_8765_length_772_cov_233.576523_3_plen_33_part_01
MSDSLVHSRYKPQHTYSTLQSYRAMKIHDYKML